eukprot:1196406-Prorocentrum_minimum.AAC.3
MVTLTTLPHFKNCRFNRKDKKVNQQIVKPIVNPSLALSRPPTPRYPDRGGRPWGYPPPTVWGTGGSEAATTPNSQVVIDPSRSTPPEVAKLEICVSNYATAGG